MAAFFLEKNNSVFHFYFKNPSDGAPELKKYLTSIVRIQLIFADTIRCIYIPRPWDYTVTTHLLRMFLFRPLLGNLESSSEEPQKN